MCLDVPADGWHASCYQEETENEEAGRRLGSDVAQHSQSEGVAEEPPDSAVFVELFLLVWRQPVVV